MLRFVDKYEPHLFMGLFCNKHAIIYIPQILLSADVSVFKF